MMQWTPEQNKVITLRDRNILVSAAAGSGKTAVLVERIIQKITDRNHPVDIDKLLVVTFTKAAAAEMKERVGNAIEELLEANPADENLRKQQTLIHNAQITTIDSFCLFVVRNHFEEIGLDPNFRIADQGELELLEQDVLEEIFEKEYVSCQGETADTSRFLTLTDAYSAKTDNRGVKEMVSKIYHQSTSSPWPEEWIRSLTGMYRVTTVEELLATPFMENICQEVRGKLKGAEEGLQTLLEITNREDGPKAYYENIKQDLEQFRQLEQAEGFPELADFCNKLEFKNLTALRNYTGDIQKKELVQEGRNGIKKDLAQMKERYFAMSLQEMVAQFGRMRDVVEELVELGLKYTLALNEKKEEKHILSFSDIEHCALNILVDKNTRELRPVAMELKAHFEEIMIDEYQDSNQVQEEILCAISGESEGRNNMFMVGDVKQSIYRFRLARPELFMEKYATYPLADSPKQRIDLHKNFRSRREVLDFTNDIFYKIMAKDLGNVAYDSDAALYYGGQYPESTQMKAEVMLLEKEEVEEEESNCRMEARMVAERMAELMKTLQITDKKTGQLRPLRYSDMVILLRGVSAWGPEFVSVLESFGIPAHVTASMGYFSATEVQLVLSILKILDNPYQDIPMAAVLKSPVVGLDNEELAEVSLGKEGQTFGEKVWFRMKNDTEGKLYEFGKLYRKMRKKVADTPIHQLIELVLEETGYGDYVKALPAGAQRSANLDMLIEKAICYEKTSYKGLFHFIRYIDRMQKYEVDFGEADVTGEGEDVVRIMTIHKSKGLEFPVVFVAGIGKKFNETDVNARLAIHPDMGIGLDEIRLTPRVKRKCLIRSEIGEQIRRDNLGEELRVLYVALTRAKEKLILTGVVKSAEDVYKKYTGNTKAYTPLGRELRAGARSYLDWIAPAVMSYPDKYHFTFRTPEEYVLSEVQSLAEEQCGKKELLEKIRRADEGLMEEIKNRMSYRYPYTGEAQKKSKYSVSELKHKSMVEAYDKMQDGAEVPEFLAEQWEGIVPEFVRKKENAEAETVKATGAQRGTAAHRVMECLDFKKLTEINTASPEETDLFLKEELRRMCDSRLITEETVGLLYYDKVLHFLGTPMAMRMAEAHKMGKLYREKPFVMDYDGVLVQGIIDVFWLEDNKVILLDYKTDKVTLPEELVARYQTQLNLYGQALGRIFTGHFGQMPETESYIYSLYFSSVIPVPKDENPVFLGGEE